MEYLDLGGTVQTLADVFIERQEEPDMGFESSNKYEPDSTSSRRYPLDPSFFTVRKRSICIASYFRDAVSDVKRRVAELVSEPLALESFHVKNNEDIVEGSLLVPKVILVAVHCPGKKLIDEDGDEGQLDILFDEACASGADIMVIYLSLPKSIYTPVRHMVYHPKFAEMVFPSQPILRHLAEKTRFITVTGDSEFTHIQKNIIREWIQEPVDDGHPVFKAADLLSSVEIALKEDDNCFSKASHNASSASPSIIYEQKPIEGVVNQAYHSAEEEHPLADIKAKKKSKRSFGQLFRGKIPRVGNARRKSDLGTLHEDMEDMDTSYELNMYRKSDYEIEIGGNMNVVL